MLEPGINDVLQASSDFFDMGGHSLLLAKLASAIADETGVVITIPELLEHATLEGMARLVEGATAARSDPTPSVFSGVGHGADGALLGLEVEVEAGPLVLRSGADGLAALATTSPASTRECATVVGKLVICSRTTDYGVCVYLSVCIGLLCRPRALLRIPALVGNIVVARRDLRNFIT